MATRPSIECSKAGRKSCVDLRKTTPQFLTTIDFGTTHCSVAYLLRPDLEPRPSEVDPTILKLGNSGKRRIPSYILFDNNGKKVAFGHEARDRYAALKQELKPQYHYFEHVKKHLQHEKVISWSRVARLGVWLHETSPVSGNTTVHCHVLAVCTVRANQIAGLSTSR